MVKMKLSACLALVFFLGGCAGTSHRDKVALTSAGICSVLGGGIGAAAGRDNRGRGAAIGVVTGALICGTLGYLLAEEPKPAPKPAPPPPPPPPAPKAERTIVLDNVLFDFDKTAIKPDAAKILDRLVTFLKENPDKRVDLEGHTDSVGTDQYNQGLSERRAASVKDYVVKKGIDGSRITARGLGKAKPIADNNTEQGRAKNRRVEVKIR
jgi:OOP family OmpA-OmpF porin